MNGMVEKSSKMHSKVVRACRVLTGDVFTIVGDAGDHWLRASGPYSGHLLGPCKFESRVV